MSLNVTQNPSPNFDERSCAVSQIILHYTDMPDAQAALARLCDREAKVSAHYLIRRDGHIFQMVDENKRAWHAGVSFWRGETDMNSASIGIELDHEGHNERGEMAAFPEAQMQALIALLEDVTARHAINRHNIVGHSDIAPGRKIDPGEAFDWAALAADGFGLWLHDVKIEDVQALAEGSTDKAVAPLQKALAAFGYQIEATGEYDAQMQAIVAAFQRHFRPTKIDGIADAETQSLIYAYCHAALRA